MILALFGCLISRKIPDEKLVEQREDAEAVYRDELITEKIISSLPRKHVKKSVRFADSSEHAIVREKDDKELVKGEIRGRIRVKVKMTKEEAARLLSKCEEGGVLEFKDVARELVEFPPNRVTVLST